MRWNDRGVAEPDVVGAPCGIADDVQQLPHECVALMEALCVLESVRPSPQPLSVAARIAGVTKPWQTLEILVVGGLLIRAQGDAREPWIAFARQADQRRVRTLITPTKWRALHAAASVILEPGPAALAHRVAAADRPDEALARDLEAVALGATEVGAGAGTGTDASVASSTLLEWAASLSPEPAGQQHRLLLAALHGVYQGESVSADLWARVERLPPSPLRSCALAGRAMSEDRDDDAYRHLRQARAARERARDRTASASPVAVDYWSRGANADVWFGEVDAVIENIEAALRCRMAQGRGAVGAASRSLAGADRDRALRQSSRRLLIRGMSYLRGPRFALSLLEQQTDRRTDPVGTGDDARRPDPAYDANARAHVDLSSDSLLLRGECRLLAGELDAAVRDLQAVLLRDCVWLADATRIRALERLVPGLFLLGNWREAASAAAELTIFAGERSVGPALGSMLAAASGRPATCSNGGERCGLSPIRLASGTGILGGEQRQRLGPTRGASGPVMRTGIAGAGWLTRVVGEPEPDRLVIEAYALAAIAHVSANPMDVADILGPLANGESGRQLHDAPAKFRSLWLPLYAEALIELGDHAASDALASLREEAQQVPYLAVTVHRLAGRLAEQQRNRFAAGVHYESGLAALTLTHGSRNEPGPGNGHGNEHHEEAATVPPLHRAQLEHAYGRLLCACGDLSSGGAWLKRASQHYSALGAVPFTRRCADDAHTFGAEEAAVGLDAALTGQEVRVARLAASGLTNRQVADELQVSVKTVEYHLGKIYRKLGIRSRRQL